MIDKKIPYFNIIMKYNGPTIFNKPLLPEGYMFSDYRENDVNKWAKMEVENNDFDTYENAILYFKNKYFQDMEKLLQRFIGVRDSNNELVGAIICWDDLKENKIVSAVHWLITDLSIQNKGIGTALVKMLIYRFSTMDMLPIYLHTQPWSYKAIGIYSKCGFKLLCNDSFRNYENQYKEAIIILEQYMEVSKYKKLISEKY